MHCWVRHMTLIINSDLYPDKKCRNRRSKPNWPCGRTNRQPHVFQNQAIHEPSALKGQFLFNSSRQRCSVLRNLLQACCEVSCIDHQFPTCLLPTWWFKGVGSERWWNGNVPIGGYEPAIMDYSRWFREFVWIYNIYRFKMMKMWIIVNYHGYTVYSKWWKCESLWIIMDILYIQNDENVNHCQLSWIYCIFKMMKMWIIVNYHGYTVYSKWWKCESLSIIMDILYIKNDENVNHCQLSWIYCILKMMKMWIIVNYHGYTVYSKWWKCESLSIIMDILYIKNDENVNHCQLSWIYCIFKMMKMWIIVNYHGYTVY